MELHQLRYFICIASHESITKASEELHVSQPALSKSMNKLESELGVELFERNGKRLSLNDKGRFFKGYVEGMLDDLDEAIARLDGHDAPR